MRIETNQKNTLNKEKRKGLHSSGRAAKRINYTEKNPPSSALQPTRCSPKAQIRKNAGGIRADTSQNQLLLLQIRRTYPGRYPGGFPTLIQGAVIADTRTLLAGISGGIPAKNQVNRNS